MRKPSRKSLAQTLGEKHEIGREIRMKSPLERFRKRLTRKAYQRRRQTETERGESERGFATCNFEAFSIVRWDFDSIFFGFSVSRLRICFWYFFLVASCRKGATLAAFCGMVGYLFWVTSKIKMAQKHKTNRTNTHTVVQQQQQQQLQEQQQQQQRRANKKAFFIEHLFIIIHSRCICDLRSAASKVKCRKYRAQTEPKQRKLRHIFISIRFESIVPDRINLCISRVAICCEVNAK